MQSADPGELRLLGRRHDFFDVINAVKWARTADFDNLSLDLIYGIPGQTLQNWQRTVKLVLGLKPDHLSLYALTIEEGTPMDHWIRRGRIARVDDDLAADMYDWAGEALEDQGFRQYEISNWARLDSSGTYYECRHNLQYWHNLPYLGLGCGAHGYLKGYRLANTTTIPGYIQAIALGKAREFPFSPATESAIPVSLGDEMEETMMLGLRLVEEGVSKSIFQRRFGVPLTDAFGEPITSLCRKGLLEWAGDQNDRLRLTRRGRLLGNQVFMQFVGGAVRT